MNYYNDHEPYVAQWLKNLIAGGMLPAGDVDSRPIQEVTANDVRGYTQCHFFAGIGGWPEALRLAGWNSDRPVWTGSSPCQPFSAAGKKKGEADERHLWPELRRLISECNPSTVFGEQVASKDGRLWLSGVRVDLEELGYAVGAADLCAAGVSAPHLRQRLFWVADTDGTECDGRSEPGGQRWGRIFHASDGGETCRMDDPESGRCGFRKSQDIGETSGKINASSNTGTNGDGSDSAFWSDGEFHLCADGKKRRIKPGLSALVDGIPGRVGAIKGYGNAIMPIVAAQFIRAFGV